MAVSIVQTKAFSSSTTTNVADASFDSNVTAGNTIICCLNAYTTTTTDLTTADTVNGTWTDIGGSPNNYSGDDWATFAYYQNAGSGFTSVTVTRSGGTGTWYFSICLIELAGVPSTGVLEAQATVVDTASPISSGNVTAAGGAGFIGTWNQDSRTMNPTFTGFTEIFEVTNPSADMPITVGQVLTTSGSTKDYNATYTGGAITGWVGLAAFKAAGGTTYPQSVGGTLTTAGALAKQQRTLKAGTLTTAGALVKRTSYTLAGTVTSTGALLKQAGKAPAGTLTTAGALTTIKTALRSVEGTLTSAGALVRLTAHAVLAGTLTSAGALVKAVSASAAGTLTTAGSVTTIKSVSQAIAGTLTTAGALLNQTGKVVVGTLTSAGALGVQTAHVLTGTLTTAGALSRDIFRALAGTVTTAGDLAGVKTALRAVEGTLTTAGVVVKQAALTLSGALTSAGALVQLTAKGLGGTLSPTGALTTIKAVSQSVAGVLTSAGALTMQVGKDLAGTLTSTGIVGKVVTKTFTGVLGLAGTIAGVISGGGGYWNAIEDINTRWRAYLEQLYAYALDGKADVTSLVRRWLSANPTAGADEDARLQKMDDDSLSS